MGGIQEGRMQRMISLWFLGTTSQSSSLLRNGNLEGNAQPHTQNRQQGMAEAKQNGPNVEAWAARFRTGPCKRFAQGKCTRGQECSYFHEGQHDPSTVSNPPRHLREKFLAAAKNYRTAVCRNFEAGTCHRGDSCTFFHAGVHDGKHPESTYDDSNLEWYHEMARNNYK